MGSGGDGSALCLTRLYVVDLLLIVVKPRLHVDGQLCEVEGPCVAITQHFRHFAVGTYDDEAFAFATVEDVVGFCLSFPDAAAWRKLGARGDG